MATICQKSETISVENGPTIEVRRMRWKDARTFLRRFAELVGTIYREAAATARASTASTDDNRVVAFATFGETIIAKLPELVASSDELVSMLCTASTDKPADDLDKLDALAMSHVLAAALRVNCDQELKNCWAGIVGSVAAMLSANPKTS